MIFSVYVDASNLCNEIAFNLAAGTSAVTRSWNIKVNFQWLVFPKPVWMGCFQVTQFDCNYDNLAPDGCTQYFFGTTTDLVKSYNFDGGQHLASQDQNICVRRERSICQICWTPTADGDFELTGGNTGAAGKSPSYIETKIKLDVCIIITGAVFIKRFCCSYGTDFAQGATGYDCLKLPGASKATDGASLNAAAYGICGGEFGSIDAGTAAQTVCCKFHIVCK